MTYRGRVQGGVVVLEDDATLPEGTEVKVDPVEQPAKTDATQEPTLSQMLLKWAGVIKDGPSDASVNLDHYLYGHPKK